MRFTVKSTTTLILASKSPRRIELMTLAGFDFLSVPAVKEEKITGGTSPSDAVLMLSRQKAEEIAEKYPYNTVIGADTVVALGNEIMGKPENEQDAFNMLKKLSGKTHTVLTGVCVISPERTQRYVIFEQRIYKRYYGVRRRSAQGSKNRRRKDISFKRRYH